MCEHMALRGSEKDTQNSRKNQGDFIEIGSYTARFMKRLICLILGITSLLQGATLEESIPYDAKGPNKVGYLHLGKDRSIDQSTLLYVKYSLEHFKQQKVAFIVLNLDTPGGEVFSALKIAEMLKEIDTKEHIPVVAYIDNWAISAGAMLAYSCRFIGVTKSSSMGAAEPVLQGGQGMEPASEKINSALRAEFSNLANFWGRNPLLAEAMVDKDVILVSRKGKIMKLETEEQIDWKKDEVISRKGKLLTLNAANLIQYSVADFESPALFEHPFFAQIPNVQLEKYHDWKIDFFSFLSLPIVSSLLFMGLLFGLYFEVQHPGFGFPAILGLACLGLILLSSFALEAVRWMELIILLTGIGILILELFVLPTFGFLGIVGIVMTVAGFAALMLPGLENFRLFSSWSSIFAVLLDKLAWLCGTLIAFVVFVILLIPRVLKRFTLKETQEGFQAADLDVSLVGKEAKAATELKPTGHIFLDGKQIQAASEGGYIPKDCEVKIVGSRGAYFIVQKKENT